MPYNAKIHHRRSIRLKAGLYFITICVQHKKCLFGRIGHNKMHLTDFGNLANYQWEKLPERFTNVNLDVYQIMPNHMHGIIMLTDVGATLAGAQTVADDQTLAVNQTLAVDQNVTDDENVANDETLANDENNVFGEIGAGASPAPTNTKTVGDIIGAYKSLVANDCLEIFKQNHPDKMMGKLLQRNYYEHIIRDEQSYQRISDYIINNPQGWKGDKFYKQ